MRGAAVRMTLLTASAIMVCWQEIGTINSLRHVLRLDRMLRIVSSEKHAKEEL